MTLENLKTALQQNNKYIIEEINAIIDYLNDPIYKSLVNDDKRITQLRTDVISLRASLAHDIETANTTLTKSLQSLNDSFKEHVEDTVVHISDEERKTWNNHKDNKTIHVTQEEKDSWNAALQNSKDYAKKTELHKHDNKDVLDKLSADADGNLLYNGEALKNGDVTTQDLNNALANYAQKSALDNYATTEVLNDYAKKTDLNQYAKSTNIANTYATKTALDDYLKKTSLSDYAKKSDLSEYAKSTDLHTHENKDTIDKFSTDKEGNLLFNGSKIRGDITKQEVDNLLQGYVKQNEYRVSADEGNIISKHDDGLYASIDDSITFSGDYSDKKVAKGKFFGQDYYETTFTITLDNTNPFKFSHGIERIADVIEIKGYIKDDTKYYPLNFNNSQRFFTGYADENYIYIDRGIFSDIDESEQDTLWLTGKTAYITIRYTLKPYQSNFITKDNRVIITKEGNVFWSLNEDKTNLITK